MRSKQKTLIAAQAKRKIRGSNATPLVEERGRRMIFKRSAKEASCQERSSKQLTRFSFVDWYSAEGISKYGECYQ